MSDSYSSYDEENFGLLSSTSFLENKPKEKSIASDLAKYNVPEDIIARADELYKQDDVKICRQRKRLHLLFYYTLGAYRSIHRDVDPNKIAKYFDLTQGDTMTAVSTFNKKKKRSNLTFSSPVKLTGDYCFELKIRDPEIVEEIVNLCRNVICKNPLLLNNYPQTVASGVLWYYFQTYNYEPDRENFETVVGRSTATIKKVAKLVSTIDNE